MASLNDLVFNYSVLNLQLDEAVLLNTHGARCDECKHLVILHDYKDITDKPKCKVCDLYCQLDEVKTTLKIEYWSGDICGKDFGGILCNLPIHHTDECRLVYGEFQVLCKDGRTYKVRGYKVGLDYTHRYKILQNFSYKNLDEDENASMQKLIAETCDEVKALLLKKNKDYGSSFAFPIGVFAKGLDAEAQIKVRIDGKLNRLKTGINEISEDTEMDLIGYLILLRVLRKINNGR